MYGNTNEFASPFRHWIVNNWFTPLKPERVADAMLHHWQVSYDNDVERGKKTSRDFITMLPELQEAFATLRSKTTVDSFSRLSAIPTLIDDPIAHGAGLHLSVEGSFLQAHVDYELHPTVLSKERRLNAILFMHHEWQPEWGGQLLLCDMSGKAIVAVDPAPGRLVIFECGPSSMHAVRVITHKQAVRLSCAVYYLADARASAVRTRAIFLPNRSKGEVPVEVNCVSL